MDRRAARRCRRRGFRFRSTEHGGLERGDLDGLRVALDTHGDTRRPLGIAGRACRDRVRATIDRQCLVKRAEVDRLAVAQDLQPANATGLGHDDRQRRQPGFELRRALDGNGAKAPGIVVGRGAGMPLRFEEQPPRRRELVVLLAATGPVQQGRHRRIELLAGIERGACLGELASRHQFPTAPEQDLGLRPRGLCGRRCGGHRDDHRNAGERSLHSPHLQRLLQREGRGADRLTPPEQRVDQARSAGVSNSCRRPVVLPIGAVAAAFSA